jgi:hypothetical protein
MDDNSEYYVYVYIDPRNFEEFYYGKGKGNRKNSHLSDDSDSEKANRIKAIKKAGLTPTIRVIAKDLTQREAFFIEKTLIWKLGRTLTNKSSGHFADKFRPHDTFHQLLSGFDFKNGLYLMNVGQGKHRCWEDCKRFSFLSAGQHKKYSDPVRGLQVGDVVAAFQAGRGYVGIGLVKEKAVRVNEFLYDSKPLRVLPLTNKLIFENSDNDKSEFLLKVKWLRAVDISEAKWKRNEKYFSSRLVVASLQGQPKTIEFIEREFKINLTETLISNEK